MSVQEIEKAAKELNGLETRLVDFFNERWDEQMKIEAQKGRLNTLINEAKEEIRLGQTKPL